MTKFKKTARKNWGGGEGEQRGAHERGEKRKRQEGTNAERDRDREELMVKGEEIKVKSLEEEKLEECK